MQICIGPGSGESIDVDSNDSRRPWAVGRSMVELAGALASVDRHSAFAPVWIRGSLLPTALAGRKLGRHRLGHTRLVVVHGWCGIALVGHSLHRRQEVDVGHYRGPLFHLPQSALPGHLLDVNGIFILLGVADVCGRVRGGSSVLFIRYRLGRRNKAAATLRPTIRRLLSHGATVLAAVPAVSLHPGDRRERPRSSVGSISGSALDLAAVVRRNRRPMPYRGLVSPLVPYALSSKGQICGSRRAPSRPSHLPRVSLETSLPGALRQRFDRAPAVW